MSDGAPPARTLELKKPIHYDGSEHKSLEFKKEPDGGLFELIAQHQAKDQPGTIPLAMIAYLADLPLEAVRTMGFADVAKACHLIDELVDFAELEGLGPFGS